MAGRKQFPLAVVLRTVDKSTANIRAINQRLGGIGRTTDKLRRKFQLLSKEAGLGKAVDRFKNNARGFAVASGIALAAIFKFTRGFTQSGDDIKKTAFKLGVGVEWLQQMRFAGERTGVAFATTDMALQRFGRRVGEAAAGTGEAQVALDALGISVFGASGQVRTLESLLPEVADKLERIENANVRNALAMKFFDSEGVKLVQTLAGGSDKLAEYFKEAKSYGLITEEAAGASEKFEDQITNLKMAFAGLRNTALGPLLPKLTELLKRAVTYLVENRDAVFGFAKGLGAVAGVLIGGKLIATLWSVVKVVKAFGLVMFATPLGLIALGIAGLVLAGWHLVKNWDKVSAWWSRTWAGITQAVSGAIDRVNSVIAGLRIDVFDRIARAWKQLKSGRIVAAFETISGDGPAAVAAAGNAGGAANTNNAAVSVDINGLRPDDKVSSRVDRGMPFDLSQGFVMAGP